MRFHGLAATTLVVSGTLGAVVDLSQRDFISAVSASCVSLYYRNSYTALAEQFKDSEHGRMSR